MAHPSLHRRAFFFFPIFGQVFFVTGSLASKFNARVIRNRGLSKVRSSTAAVAYRGGGGKRKREGRQAGRQGGGGEGKGKGLLDRRSCCYAAAAIAAPDQKPR